MSCSSIVLQKQSDCVTGSELKRMRSDCDLRSWNNESVQLRKQKAASFVSSCSHTWESSCRRASVRRRRWSWWHRAEPWRGTAGGNIRCRRFQEERSRVRRHTDTQCSSAQTDTHRQDTGGGSAPFYCTVRYLKFTSSFAKYHFAHCTHLLIPATLWSNNEPKMSSLSREWFDCFILLNNQHVYLKLSHKSFKTSKFSWLIEWENSRLRGQEQNDFSFWWEVVSVCR